MSQQRQQEMDGDDGSSSGITAQLEAQLVEVPRSQQRQHTPPKGRPRKTKSEMTPKQLSQQKRNDRRRGNLFENAYTVTTGEERTAAAAAAAAGAARVARRGEGEGEGVEVPQGESEPAAKRARTDPPN
eukprot:Hpha_TRINITY_DN15293_c0_g3::TRINITY_DN15293_c0_g3_i1::g.67484::m.67484